MTAALEPAQRRPYDRLPREGAKAFHAFTVYRDQGPTRSLGKTIATLKEHGTAHGMVAEWSTKWGWGERARAWDDEQDRVKLEAQVAGIRESQQLAISAWRAGIQLGAEALGAGDADGVFKPGDIKTPLEALKMIELCVEGLGMSDRPEWGLLTGEDVYELTRQLVRLALKASLGQVTFDAIPGEAQRIATRLLARG